MNNIKKKIYEMDQLDIHYFIKKHLPIKNTQKDKYGEVFTNPDLINKMLDLFPNNVWTNYKLTWLDPSVGAGFFLIFVYFRFMNGLKKWEIDIKKRSKHIIENMLFMVEINKINCNICKNLFGAKLNIICGDFLEPFKFHKCDHLSFDCIVGNPPFHDDYGPSNTGKRINGGKSKLYERFFLKSFTLLKNGGYLSFLVPDNIFSGNGTLSYQIIIQNHIPFVSFNPSNQTFFPQIQQPVCYFILHKAFPNGFTRIQHNDLLTFQIKLPDRPVNPIRNWTPHTEKLINQFVSLERNNIIYNRGKNIKSYKGHKYTVIFTPYKNLQTNNSELAPGLGIKKVIIFSISPNLAFKMDYSGEFAAGPNTFILPFNTISQGKKIEKFLNSNDYKTLALATKTSRQFLKIAFIEHLKLSKIFGTNKTCKCVKNHHNKTRKYKY